MKDNKGEDKEGEGKEDEEGKDEGVDRNFELMS